MPDRTSFGHTLSKFPVRAYSASIVNMIDGAEKNRWFRPSDVCVAPDGSLIVADWYDPGVGGHRMQDVQRGRLFRVTAKNAGGKYQSPAVDFSTPELSAQALCSPNLATPLSRVGGTPKIWKPVRSGPRSFMEPRQPSSPRPRPMGFGKSKRS